MNTLSVAIVSGQHVGRADELNASHSQYLDACSNFREIVFSVFKELNFEPPILKRGYKYPPEWQKILDEITTDKIERERIQKFLRGWTNITPRTSLYFKLCKSLGISPDEAGFNYKIIRPELIS